MQDKGPGHGRDLCLALGQEGNQLQESPLVTVR